MDNKASDFFRKCYIIDGSNQIPLKPKTFRQELF